MPSDAMAGRVRIGQDHIQKKQAPTNYRTNTYIDENFNHSEFPSVASKQTRGCVIYYFYESPYYQFLEETDAKAYGFTALEKVKRSERVLQLMRAAIPDSWQKMV